MTRAARLEADALLERWGVENPTRDELIERLSGRSDRLAIIYDMCHSTVAQWARRTSGKHAILSPAGLIVSRLRNFDLASPLLDLAWVRQNMKQRKGALSQLKAEKISPCRLKWSLIRRWTMTLRMFFQLHDN